MSIANPRAAVSKAAKRSLRQVLDGFGIEVGRPGPGRIVFQSRARAATPLHRSTLLGALRSAAALGFQPGSVIDVGAASGTFPLYDTFPQARHLLIEPLDEFRGALNEIATTLQGAVFIGTAGATEGTVAFNVHPDLNGSSLFEEKEDSDVNGQRRVVPQSTLDILCVQHSMPGPFLLKVDTQGAELEVLKGAEHHVLPRTEVAVLEVSFLPFFTGAPEVAEVVGFLRERGLVPYDVVDQQYRPIDGALSQVDIVFVREDSQLRGETRFATRQQRQDLTSRFTKHHKAERHERQERS